MPGPFVFHHRRVSVHPDIAFPRPACHARPMSDTLNLIGRILIALLFLGGAVQKVMDPVPVQEMIASIGLPLDLVWPVALFNAAAVWGLIFGPGVRLWAVVLAGYCIFTSYFHWQLRADPWQVSIMVKNWAIAGGLLVLAAQGPGRFALRLR
jgi:putative oxidoreductase